VSKVSAFCLDMHADGCTCLDCRINDMLVKFTVMSCWERHYVVKAVRGGQFW